MTRRYVHGPDTDEPLLDVSNPTAVGGGTKRWLYADERGSVVAMGTTKLVYDEYGVPTNASFPSRFGYTGQLRLRDIDMWHYKARIYAPGLGRFLQN